MKRKKKSDCVYAIRAKLCVYQTSNITDGLNEGKANQRNIRGCTHGRTDYIYNKDPEEPLFLSFSFSFFLPLLNPCHPSW